MRFGVLGPLEVTSDDGAAVDVGGRQPRSILVALLAAGEEPVRPEALVDAVWGDEPPRTALATIQSYVSRLRTVFDRHGGPQLRLEAGGYRLAVDPDDVDVGRFERLSELGRAKLADGEIVEARDLLSAALALWRGPALLDLADRPAALAQATELDERRHAALDARFAADLALGRHHEIVAELRSTVAEHPFHESYHAKLALALYRAGRQADALRAITDAGTILREELGLSPGRELVALELAILNQDSSLDLDWTVASLGTDGARPGRLCGRRHELGLLVDAYDQAGPEARFVVIEGDPGIGKTRLADELRRLARERGAAVASGWCDESGAAPALCPWLPILRELVDDCSVDAPKVREVLAGDAPMIVGRGGALRFALFDEVARLLEATGAHTRLVTTIDDLQWADSASLQLLQFLASRPLRSVLFVVTIRSLELGRRDEVTDTLAAIARRPGSERIVLAGLSAEETADLVDSVTTDADADGRAEQIHERAEGNPFYTIELARLLDRSGAGEHDVPPTVGDVVSRRLAGLGAGTVELLELAAAAGREFRLDLLAAAAGMDLGGVVGLLEPALAHRLVVAVDDRPGSFRFTHALVREVLLGSITALHRARLHLQVADAIDAAGAGIDDVEFLAEHLWQAAALAGADRVTAALERAAEIAIRRVAYSTAEHLLMRAARLRREDGSDEQRELQTVLRLLEVMQATRYYSGTDRAFLDRALELAERLGLDDTVRTLHWAEWSAMATSARTDEGAPLAERFHRRWVDDERPNVRANARSVRAVALWATGRIGEAVVLFDEAVDLLADADPPADAFQLESRLATNTFSLWNHAALGDRSFDDVMADFEAMFDAWPPLTWPSICGFASTIAATFRRWEVLDRLTTRAFEADPAAQFAFWGGQLLMYRGLVMATAGDPDGGSATFVEGRARYRALGAGSGLPTFEALMGESMTRLGRAGEGAEFVATARRRLTRTHELWNETTVCVGEAVVAQHAGDTERARERLLTAIDVATGQGARGFAAEAARVAAELGHDITVETDDEGERSAATLV